MEEKKVNSRRVPLDKRKRTETSCDKCKSRKQKCHRPAGNNEATCSYCLKHNIQCITTQPRKTRIYGSVEGLSTRLALLEGLVKGLLPEADLSSIDDMRELGVELGIPLPASHDAGTAVLPSHPKHDVEAEERLMQDQQGQTQYIGPASSFLFYFKLRTIFGRIAPQVYNSMQLFGRNAADSHLEATTLGSANTILSGVAHAEWDILSASASSPGVEGSPVSTIDSQVLDSLVSAFFDHVHPDFPVLHEASFRETYESWTNTPGNVDRTWLCCLLCVLLLGRRVAPIQTAEASQESWWRQVQALLPTVLFSSSVTAVQGLLLTSLHLHHNLHRDACWTLTGAAVRIAFAIGLHRDNIRNSQTPLSRELRKQLWWTLYAFEKMQVSSQDRPSAIEDTVYSVGCPRESILGMGGHSPPEYLTWSNRLTVMLGVACRATRATSVSFEDSTIGPLSPTARLLRDLDRWKQGLPQHLRPDAIEQLPPSFQRPIILLHCQYHYIVSLLSRSALLARATASSNLRQGPLSQSIILMSDACIESGRILAQLSLKMEAIHKYNVVTWWDVYYTFSSSLVLTLDIICNMMREEKESAIDSRRLLGEIAALLARQTKNPMCPGTLVKWAEVAQEMDPMTQDFVRTFKQEQSTSPPVRSTEQTDPLDTEVGEEDANGEPDNMGGLDMVPNQHQNQNQNQNHHVVPEMGGVPMMDPSFAHPSRMSNHMRWTHLAFPDPTTNMDTWHEMHWDDIGNMLLGEQQ